MKSTFYSILQNTDNPAQMNFNILGQDCPTEIQCNPSIIFTLSSSYIKK